MKGIITKANNVLVPHDHDDVYYTKTEVDELGFYKIFDCDSSTVIGDTVYLSSSVNNYVVANTNNRVDEMSIGIVVDKISTTVAKVQVYGTCNFEFIGLQKGKRAWLSPSGGVTSIIPVNGYAHILGMCFEDNYLFINPELNKLKRYPF